MARQEYQITVALHSIGKTVLNPPPLHKGALNRTGHLGQVAPIFLVYIDFL
jgi:hypothetical protein